LAFVVMRRVAMGVLYWAVIPRVLHSRAISSGVVWVRVTGDDGPSRNSVWDLSVFQVVPGLRIAAAAYQLLNLIE
jgi:hypothetical protein